MPRDRKRIDVLVLGAGAAGLAAARDLSHAGLRVTVIEARPRGGGRILTLPDTHELVSAGRFKPMGDFWEVVDRMNRDLAGRVARRGKDFAVSEYLESASVPASRRGMLRDFLQGFYAAHPDRLSAKSLAVETEGGDEEDEVEGRQFRIANGGDALMKWLRDGLDPDRTEVRLSTVAVSVQWKQGGVSVVCRGSSDRAPLHTLSARTALITLPLAVLKAGDVRFDPAVPGKQRALAGIETGQVFKIVLRFREAFWERAEFLKERREQRGSNGRGLNFLHAHGA